MREGRRALSFLLNRLLYERCDGVLGERVYISFADKVFLHCTIVLRESVI